MYLIMITFHDNDFRETLNALLVNLYSIWKKRKLSKEDVINIIQKGIEWHYFAYQHNNSNTSIERTVSYLKKELQIYFDEEASSILFDSNKTLGHEYCYLELSSGQIGFW